MSPIQKLPFHDHLRILEIHSRILCCFNMHIFGLQVCKKNFLQYKQHKKSNLMIKGLETGYVMIFCCFDSKGWA